MLDMTAYNSETNYSRLFGVTRAMQSAGVPYDTTSSLANAFNYPVIITGSRILQDAFTSTERAQIETFVSNGGVFITSSMRDTTFYTLCGISDMVSEDTLYEIVWDTTTFPQYYDLIDDSLEVTISLGDSSSGSTFYTRYYALNGATAMGHYENGECALAYNTLGFGHVYTFGPDFRDVIYRNQIDLDISAQRTYSNGFEPTSDVFVFLFRNIIRQHIPNTVYKYTVPGTATSAIMITHDIDSGTGIDTMGSFSAFEQAMGIVAQYNITTRYFSDGWMSAFYVGAWPEINAVKSNGHVLASHSVGHFPDFADDAIFPYGTTGNTPVSYQPYYTGGITTDGTILGELEVSRDLLEGDFTVNIRSFRAGHLAYPDSLVLGLQQLGYEYNSTHSANNVLTGFPYYATETRSFSTAQSSVLEIPMTISDVFSSDPIDAANYQQKVGIWADVTRRYDANNAPVVLLIHPNRMYKLTAMQDYLDSLPTTSVLLNFEAFGDYWRKRDSLQFHTVLTADTLLVVMDNNLLVAEQSFVVDMAGLDTVRFFDDTGTELAMSYKAYSATQRLYYQNAILPGITEHGEPINLTVYPNPATHQITVGLDDDRVGALLQMFSNSGKLVLEQTVQNRTPMLNIETLQPGAYYITVVDKKGVGHARFIKLYP